MPSPPDKCDYAGCHQYGEQKVVFSDDPKYWYHCEEHALPGTDTGYYRIEREVRG